MAAKPAIPTFPRAGDCSSPIACLAGLSHILLDFTNNYGVRAFWPFSERWISWDSVFIVDPVILVVLTLGLILPGLFSLINEEIGARNKDARRPHREDWPRPSLCSPSSHTGDFATTNIAAPYPRSSRAITGAPMRFEFPRIRTGSIRFAGTA